MNLTPEQRDQAAAELKRIGADLDLSEEQKSRLQEALAEARVKVTEYLKSNPNMTREDIAKQIASHRDQIRQRVVNFLNPEQLKKWDADVAKAKEFLGQKLAA
jgi:periplasmic protein CpxP/Spy